MDGKNLATGLGDLESWRVGLELVEPAVGETPPDTQTSGSAPGTGWPAATVALGSRRGAQ